MLRVFGAKAVWHEFLDALSDYLLPRITDQVLGLRIHEHDVAGSVHDHDRMRSSLQEPADLLLPLPAFGDVADRARDQRSFLGLERAQADFDRELRAVLAQTIKLETGAHGTDFRVREVTASVCRVAGTKALGDEDLHKLAHKLDPRVAEEPLGLRAHENDP